MDSQKLAEMLTTIQEKNINIHGLLIIRNSYIVSDTYFGSYKHTRHRSPINAFVNIVAGLITYCHLPKKPSWGIMPAGMPLLVA